MGPFPCSTTTKRKSRKSKLGFQEHDANAFPEVCVECGKSFRSRKAVYGHTRIHRNRHQHRHGSINEPPEASSSPISTTTMTRGDEHDAATSLLSLADLSLADVKRVQQPSIDGDDKGEIINNVLKISSAGFSSGNPNGCDSKHPVLDLNLPPPSEKVDNEYEVDLELRLGRLPDSLIVMYSTRRQETWYLFGGL